MPTYRARSCPNCNYYLGFTVAKPSPKTSEVSVNGLCFNCGYKIPMHAIVMGTKKATRSKTPIATDSNRRKNISKKPAVAGNGRETGASNPGPPPARRYSVDLRAIGQELAALHLNDFTLECTGASYLVRARKESAASTETTSSSAHPGPLRTFWQRVRGDVRQPKGEIAARLSSGQTTYRYDPADIERIDRAGKARRQPGSGIIDGHSLSQLLRTLGAVISQRSQRLLAISWQDASISVVVETPQGQRQLDIFRHDNIYDFWVKGYLRRTSRVYSDVPT